MSTPSVTITAMIKGALNRVTITKTGPTTVTAETRVWNSGVNPEGPPSSDNTVTLTNCTASADGLLLSATPPGFGSPKLAIVLTADPSADTVEMVVAGELFGIGNSDTTSQISQVDYTAAVAFVKECSFPLPN